VLQQLDVPYLDASASHLVWRLDAPVQAALATQTVASAAWTLELRLLGASHQVVARSTDGEVVCTELVACLAGEPGDLPSAIDEERTGLRYRFRSVVERTSPQDLAGRAEALVARLGGRDDALVGAFPGSPHAVTAIEVTRSGWRTWHVYPQAGEIVETDTSLGRSA
jgi:fermentation-respiration switch protein FrsA (DUF1100 family)